MDGGSWYSDFKASSSLQYSEVNRQLRHADQSFEHTLYMLSSRIRQWLAGADA